MGSDDPVDLHGGDGPGWAAHLPAGLNQSDVDLGAGGSLPGAWLAAWAAEPQRTVLSTLDGERVSAAELADRSAGAAGWFRAAGLEPGDRVLFAAGTSVALVVAFTGAVRAGLTVVPANPGSPPAELAGLVTAAGARLAVLEEPGRLPGAPIPVVGPELVGQRLEGRRPARTEEGLDAAVAADPALVIFTSGTTGRPKAVPLSHGNLLASAHAVRLAWRWEPDDRLALCLPLFHVHGLGVGLIGSLVTGADVILIPRFTPAAVAGAVTDQRATMLFGVPTMYHDLAASDRLAELAGLRLAVSGSAPLPAALHDAIRAGCGQSVLERYGMTETLMLVSNPYDGPRRPGTVGFPLPGVELRLADRPDGTAEIEVHGPSVITGYLDDPAATASAFTVDGWLRTGDLGSYDDDGYLRISGRAKDLIITGGFNVAPREVEEVLLAHPEVADAAVVGAPSERWGETVVAFVVPANGRDAAVVLAELPAWCAERLVSYRRPREWRLIDTVPRNALGKIQRHLLVP